MYIVLVEQLVLEEEVLYHNHISLTNNTSNNTTHAYNIPTVAITPSSVHANTSSIIVTRPHDHPPVVGRW